MTLDEYRERIERLERMEGCDPEESFSGTLAGSAAERLARVSQEIRRCLWRGTYHQEAMDLAARADESANRIARENGLSECPPLPRFNGFTSGGIYHHPIQ